MILFFLAAAFAGTAAAKDTLAVLPFTGGIGNEGETIAELFSFSDELNEVFDPIPRTSISRAINNEQTFQSTGMTDPDTIAALGKQLGAKYVVAGKIAKLGDFNLLIISIVKIDELRQIAGDFQTYSKIEEIQGKLPGMAGNIISATRKEASNIDKLAVVAVDVGSDIDSSVADTLAQILSINLIRSGKYAVYPRTGTLEYVQREYENQLSGITADENIVDIGKGDNPNLVLSVAARRLGGQNMFNASIINLESGIQVIGRSVNYDTLNDGITAMENLSRGLTGAAGGSLSGGELEAVRDRAAAFGGRTSLPAAEETDKDASGGGDASGGRAGGRKKAGGNAFGYGALNLALGLGSFVQGDWGGGFTCLIGYGAAAGLILWDVLALSYEDDLAGVPGTVGLGVAGVTALYGFIRPAVYKKSHTLAGIMDRINIAAAPGGGGGKTVRLSYSLRF
jgi:TolB-like protein